MVHVVGGICALWGAKILGERYGKDKDRLRRQGRLHDEMTESITMNDHEF